MEELKGLLETIGAFTPIGVATLLELIIFVYVWKNPFKPIENKLEEVTSNHLHSLPQMAEDLSKAVEILQRIEVRMAEDFSYLKAKINGNLR